MDLFVAGLGKKAEEETEGDGRSDAAGGGAEAPKKDAQKAMGIDSLLDPLSKGVAEAGEWDSCACLTKCYKMIIEPESCEPNTGADIKDGNSGGSPVGFVDQDLGDGAEGAAYEKCF